MEKVKTKQRLDEIVFIRPVAILFILIGHCFCIYSGAWDVPKGLVIPEFVTRLYSGVSPFFIYTSLPLFVLVSGYITAFQEANCKVKIHAKKFIWKKFKRLIIPCIFFSVLYLLLLQFNEFKSKSFISVILYVINGAGHLWFLSMLFCVSVIGYFIMPYVKRYYIWFIVGFILLFSVYSLYDLPLGVAQTPFYLPFYILGFYLFNYRERLIAWVRAQKLFLVKIILILVCLFGLFAVLKSGLLRFLPDCDVTIALWIRWLIGYCGAVCLFLFGLRVSSYRESFIVKSIDSISKYSFPIYIYHQFILLIVFEYSIFRFYMDWANLHPYIFPLLTFVLVLLFSLLLSYLTYLTKIGRRFL